MKPIGYNKHRMRRDYVKIQATVPRARRLRLFPGNFFQKRRSDIAEFYRHHKTYIRAFKRGDTPRLIKENDVRATKYVHNAEKFYGTVTISHDRRSRLL